MPVNYRGLSSESLSREYPCHEVETKHTCTHKGNYEVIHSFITNLSKSPKTSLFRLDSPPPPGYVLIRASLKNDYLFHKSVFISSFHGSHLWKTHKQEVNCCNKLMVVVQVLLLLLFCFSFLLFLRAQ